MLLEILRWLLKLFNREEAEETEELLLPTSTERISSTLLYTILRQVAPKAQLFLSDRGYLLCNVEDIKRFLEQDGTDRRKYISEKHDCDDFSYRLMGQFSVPKWADLTFGIIWTNVHALNCFVDEEGDFYLLEPQTDGVSKVKKDFMDENIRIIMM